MTPSRELCVIEEPIAATVRRTLLVWKRLSLKAQPWAADSHFTQALQLLDCALASLHADRLIQRVSISVRAEALYQSDFSFQITERLQQHAIDPRRLCLELTDLNSRCAIEKLRDRLLGLRHLGIAIAVDEFSWTGTPGMALLAHGVVDIIKIGAELMAICVESRTANPNLLPAVVDFARKLNVAVVFCGIDSADCARLLPLGEGIHFQGSFFGRSSEVVISSSGPTLPVGRAVGTPPPKRSSSRRRRATPV